MEERIRVVQHGLGVVGKVMARVMLKKMGIEIVGAVTRKSYVGEDLGDVVGINEKLGVIISNDLDSVLSQTRPDVMLDASSTHIKELYPIFMKALEARVNVISVAGEAFNPWHIEPELAKTLDETAKRNGVTVVGTGLHPGFYLDVLPLFFTGVCGEVRKIISDRCTDTARAGPTFRSQIGLGLPKDVVEKKLAEGKTASRFGDATEIYFIADCLGWEITDVRDEIHLLISNIVRDHSPDYKIEPGQVYGLRYECYGIKDGEKVIEIKSTLCVDPTLETDGFVPHYTLTIEGEPSLTIDASDLCLSKNITIETASPAVNWIPHIIRAKPGLLTSARDYPLVTCLP